MIGKAPYGTVYAAEAIRTIMGLAAFEVNVEILFIHDGVFVALKDQKPKNVEMKSLGDILPNLKEMDIKNFYVYEESLTERNITMDQLVMDVKLCNADNIEQLLDQYDHIIPF